ncbi:MAG: 2'-deoxycytidine 5'-triphosphate deaminase [Rhodospirillales bacterium]|nr:2'-deoxycytidine 5'-triphosphate deaminase [Rhodospirillales bacterium]
MDRRLEVAGEEREGVIPGLDERGGAAPPAYSTGLLPAQEIRALVRSREVQAACEIDEAQIQPASLDLRLGDEAWRVRASFLPGPEATVAERLVALGMHRISLGDGAVLEKGCVYIVPLLESLALKSRTSGMANPKSSTGRLDVFTRLITDRSGVFDQVAAGYKGPLYAEISPRTFSIVVRRGSSVSQLRLRRGSPPATDTALRRLHRSVPLVAGDEGADAARRADADIDEGIAVTVDLAPRDGKPVGWRARHHSGLIDLGLIGHYDPHEYWEPVTPDGQGCVVLNPGDFYILASRQAVTVPPDHAAEMRPYDTRVGEFRVHYAGFFDPGFGFAAAGGEGSRAVLEIRSFEVPFALRHDQLVGRLVYERLTAPPERLYGSGIGSSYQRQGLQLAKQFRRPS